MNLAKKRKNLQTRARMLRELRSFFDERGFLEVQTPTLCSQSVIDRHLDPIRVPLTIPGKGKSEWFLQTSPELSMKRLLAEGLGSIYQIGPVFRDSEFGSFHNPEFTMAEWYDVGATYDQGLELLSTLVSEMLQLPLADRLTFECAFHEATQLRLFDSSAKDLANWATRSGLVDDVNWTDDWDDWVNLIFSDRIQPTLGMIRPTMVTNFPASQAALAVLSLADARTAERYEIFYQGVELANGYHELLDSDVLRERDEASNRARLSDGKQALPMCEKLLNAMESGIPGSCGCALGFDRLVMLACGANSLAEVVSFTAADA